MNNPASNKESSKPSKSIKQSHRVEAQLAHRKKAKSDAVSETVTTPASAIELIPASPLPPVEKVHVEAETAEPVEILPELQPRKVEQVDRKMLGKVKRAFLKAKVEAGPEAQAAFLNDLLMANVPVLNLNRGNCQDGPRKMSELVSKISQYKRTAEIVRIAVMEYL